MAKRMIRLVAGIAGTSLAATALVGAVSTPSWGATESDEFEYAQTGEFADPQPFTVPAGITEIGITGRRFGDCSAQRWHELGHRRRRRRGGV